MKTLILALLTLSFSAPVRAAENGFTCFSRWYRDAELTVNSGVISVQDSYVGGSQEIGKIVAAKLKLGEGDFVVNTIALHVNRDQSLSCSGTGLLVDCEGRADRAHVVVKGWITAGEMRGELNLALPVELKSLNLRTHLRSAGPHKIGSDVTKIELGYLNLDATAKVAVNGQEVDLAWETFFNSRDDKTGSSACSKDP